MNATELLNQVADLIEKDGWRPDDDGFEARCIGNAILNTWEKTDRVGLVFQKCFDAVYKVIGVQTLGQLWRWNDTVCLDQAEAVNTIRKAAENV